MKDRQNILLPLYDIAPVEQEAGPLQVLIIGGGEMAWKQLQTLQPAVNNGTITVIAPVIHEQIRSQAAIYDHILLAERSFTPADLDHVNVVIVATRNEALNELVKETAGSKGVLFHSAGLPEQSDLVIYTAPGEKGFSTSEKKWRKIATYLVAAFILMVAGHLIISILPLPPVQELIREVRPYFNAQFLFFVLAGFFAQLIDGALSMGYGVVSATCLMSFGVSPVSVSAAIHTSEIVTTGISGYSHYKFGNVNKKLFKHLVVPGVLGAIAGALLLVLLGEKAGKWLMPVIAFYAMILGLKILLRAFDQKKASSKAKRIGWLAGTGGFLDSFGGGGWGPIVTSTLIAKGRSPRYTVGSVSLTEFFVTLASATTFFLTVGIHHLNIVLGLIIGGAIAAPIAARLAGKLPRKTMMIAVGIMVMIWCARMIVKSFF